MTKLAEAIWREGGNVAFDPDTPHLNTACFFEVARFVRQRIVELSNRFPHAILEVIAHSLAGLQTILAVAGMGHVLSVGRIITMGTPFEEAAFAKLNGIIVPSVNLLGILPAGCHLSTKALSQAREIERALLELDPEVLPPMVNLVLEEDQMVPPEMQERPMGREHRVIRLKATHLSPFQYERTARYVARLIVTKETVGDSCAPAAAFFPELVAA